MRTESFYHLCLVVLSGPTGYGSCARSCDVRFRGSDPGAQDRNGGNRKLSHWNTRTYYKGTAHADALLEASMAVLGSTWYPGSQLPRIVLDFASILFVIVFETSQHIQKCWACFADLWMRSKQAAHSSGQKFEVIVTMFPR